MLLTIPIPILNDIALIFGISILIILIFHKWKIPSIIGYLLAGTLVGPHGFSLINRIGDVEAMAEIGVILLLFVIGLEFSLKEFRQIKDKVVIGGGMQVILTIIATCLLFWGRFHLNQTIFIGFLISMSSTAIVLRILQEKGEVHSPHGKIVLAILIFQDIVVVPMMLLLPLLSDAGDVSFFDFTITIAKGLGVVALILFSSKYFLPTLLTNVAKTRNKELFLITIVVICIVVAWITNLVGLSLALGAFIAGLIISESDYSHEATSIIIPFREVFSCLFFVSIGMLFKAEFLLNNFISISLITTAILLTKFLIVALACWALKLSLRTILFSASLLLQIGEFAFILAREGVGLNLISATTYQYFLASSILTMMATPFIYKAVPNFYKNWISKFKQSRRIDEALNRKMSQKEGHLIIVGFGLNGRNVAYAAKHAGIPYSILELNAETVVEEKLKGEPILFGDGIHDHTLNVLGVKKAAVIVIAISDPSATSHVIKTVRNLNASIHIIVRTRFVKEVQMLIKAGANEVIPEEFETSIQIFTQVLNQYRVRPSTIDNLALRFRKDIELINLQKSSLNRNS